MNWLHLHSSTIKITNADLFTGFDELKCLFAKPLEILILQIIPTLHENQSSEPHFIL